MPSHKEGKGENFLKRSDNESRDQPSTNYPPFTEVFKQDNLEQYFREQLKIIRFTGEALARLATIVKDSNDAILLLDLKGNIIAWNHGAVQMYGYTVDEACRMNISAIVPPDKKAFDKDMIKRVASGELVESIETTRITKDGKQLIVWLTVTALKDDKGHLYAISTIERDITQIKKLEHDLKTEKERDLAKEKKRTEFYLDLMTHDIRNLNQIALGYQELLADSSKLDDSSKALVMHTIEAINNSSRLIDNVKKIQHIEDKKNNRIVMCLGDILESVIKIYSNIEGVTINLTPVNDCRILANPFISDAFSNIIHNAIKYSNKPVTININMTQQKENGKLYCKVIIEDNGVGIPDKRKHGIFEREKNIGYMAGSKGIGLSLVHSIIEDLNGTIWVEDRVQGDYTKGSKFIILIPAITS